MKFKPIPEVTTKLANQTLEPYFDSIFYDLLPLSEDQRRIALKLFTAHVEKFARKKSTSWVVRMQLRINTMSLMERLVPPYPAEEVNVQSKNVI